MTQTESNHPKLTRRLKRTLLITLLAVLVIATGTAAVTAYLEAIETQDETLLSVAQLVESNQMRAASDDDVFDDDDFDKSAVRVWELGGKSLKEINGKKTQGKGFQTILEGDDFWRIYLTEKDLNGKQFIVAQHLSVSAELAMNSAINTALPLLLLFLVVPLMVTWIVRHSFKPLNEAADKVVRSSSLQLNLSNRNDIPEELMPFVSAIDKLLEKNQSYNRQQRRFIADAAHELRTPITALSLQIENIQAATDADIKSKRQLQLTTSTARLQRLVSQLLDLARLQSNLERNEHPARFDELVKNQIADLYPLVENGQIQLDVLNNSALSVMDNNHQLQHLIRNALSNAIKYSPPESIVTISLYEDSGDALFEVIDQGPGVGTDEIENLLQPFYRPDDQASGSGAGLGLAICQEIANQLNGDIRLDNQKPAGFRFQYRQAISADL